MVQLDVLLIQQRNVFQEESRGGCERMDFKAIGRNTWLGSSSWGLSRALPVFLMLIFGQNLVNLIVDYMPEWLDGGFTVAGGLSAVGNAILLRYLPVKSYISYLLVGFLLLHI